MRVSIVLSLILAVFVASTSAATASDERAGAPLAQATTGPVPAEFRADEPVPLPQLPGRPVPTDPRDGIGRQGREDRVLAPEHREIAENFLAQKAAAGDLGGDEVVIIEPMFYLDDVFVDVASNGDIYVAVQRDADSPTVYDEWFDVYRSDNGGTTFDLFGTINSGSDDYDRLYDIMVVEGAVDRLYATYMFFDRSQGGFDMRVAYTDIPSATASWQIRTVMNEPGVSFLGPDTATDVFSFSTFYMYAVCAGLDGNGDDIWFARSTDYGNTWAAPFRIAEITSSGNLMYTRPQVGYSPGGIVQVGYGYTERLQSTFDDGVRYRRGVSYGASPANWTSTTWALTPTDDGVDQLMGEMVTSGAGNTIGLTYFTWNGSNPQLFASLDAGVTWNTANKHDLPFDNWVDMEWDPVSDRFYAVGDVSGSPEMSCISSASVSSLNSWDPPQSFGETGGGYGGDPTFALDPTRGNRAIVGWTQLGSADYRAVVDAEWRSDTGYPNYEGSFPISLPSASGVGSFLRTAPAIMNVDADSYDEIVFSDRDGKVYLLSHLGDVVGGWPRNAGAIPWNSAVAVGDLNGDGQNVIVQGSSNGMVYAWERNGDPVPGFPVDLGTGAPTYCSIGAVGPPYARWILAASGNKFARINYRGLVEFKSGTLVGSYQSAPAVGDVDNDGDTEIVLNFNVTSGGSGIHIYNGDLQGGVQKFRSFPSDLVNDRITMGDLDGDGDLEIAHPTASGILYVMDHNLSDLPGFPFNNGGKGPVTAAAWDQILGTFEPELIFASNSDAIHVLYSDGDQQTGYPATTGSGWFIRGAPVTSYVSTLGKSVILGSRDSNIWAFRNIQAIVPAGFPKNMGDQIEVSPAVGDIDKDGRREMVFVGNESVHVVDIGPVSIYGAESWPMYGGDPQRTGCMDCTEELATPAPVAGGVTRVGFRIASQNPSYGPVSFAADLPARGVAELKVFDVRGRRVRLVERRELDAGTHQLSFNGRDEDGVKLARGHYFARLSVRGDGFEESAVRKFVLID